MKHTKRGSREVTDPVTHLLVTIHDSTDKDLKRLPENLPSAGSGTRTSTGPSAASKSDAQLYKEAKEGQAEHEGMEKLFPPPHFDATEEELVRTYRLAIKMSL